MKLNQLILFFLIVFCSKIYAQDSKSFQFQEFTNATIFYKNGTITYEKVNYNLINQSLYFIDKKDNQIKVVSSFEIIGYIIIDNRKYLIDTDGLKEMINSTPIIYVQIKAKTKAKERTIGYGGSDGVASTTTYSEYKSGGQISTLQNNTYEVSKLYKIYWIEKNNKREIIANFKQLLKLYANKKELIKQYIKTNEVNLEDVNQFVDLVKYAESL
jgi:hypothetical protein